MQALLIHGLNGSPDKHWFPWLKKELESRGYEVIAPQFPLDEQNFDSWYSEYKKIAHKLSRDSIIIAHSMGVPFTLKIIEKALVPVSACFLVGGFFESLSNENKNHIIHSFVKDSFDFAAIKKNCKRFFIYASQDDDAVPLNLTLNLAKHLDEDPIIFEDAGHFRDTDGYSEFEDLLIDVLSLDN